MTVDRFRKLTSFSAVVVIAVAFAFPLGAREASFLPDDSPFVGYEMKIPMRDGTHLVGDVYVPKAGGGPFPVILIQTPYNKANQRPAFADGGDRWGGLFSNTDYAFVVVDWRGRFASRDAAKPRVQGGGGQDGFDTVAWIAEQEFSNGKIGGWGSSALGGAQFKTAALNPPNLTCIAPAVVPLNMTYETFFPGGVIWEEFVKMLGRLGWNLYDQLIQQPVKNQTWQMIEASTYIKPSQIQVPVLMVGGWYDLYTDEMIDNYHRLRAEGGDAARAHTTLIMGPWLHSGLDQERQGELDYPGAVGYSAPQTIAFFDHFLRGVDNGFDTQPSFHYYQMGTEEWRTTNSWPPKEAAAATPFYLQPGGGLSTDTAAADAAPDRFTFNPANPAPTVGSANLNTSLKQGPWSQAFANAFRQDVLVYLTPVLEQDLTIAGEVRAKLFVSSDRPDTDFTAILVDVHPDRRQMLVREGILRMRFREGTDKEVLMESGTVYQATVEIGNTAITFPKGHRVGVIVSSSSSPRYDVNLNDGGPMYTGGKGQIAINTVHHDEEHPSALILPVDLRVLTAGRPHPIFFK
jgi:predicted acyl esterase